MWTYLIDDDGQLRSGERFMTMETGPGEANSGGDGLTTDAEGRAWITSNVGIQLFDPAGRLSGVLTRPQDRAAVSCTFGGSQGDYLYVCSADKVYRRHTLTRGVSLGR